MADSPAFEFACDMLERETSLERLEARGTVRLALKGAGLDPKSLTPHQLSVVATKLLPQHLVSRGVGDAESVCTRLSEGLRRLDAGNAGEAPESLFVRMGAA